MRDGAFIVGNGDDAVFVDDLRLLHVEGDAALCLALALQDLREFDGVFDEADEVGVLRLCFPIAFRDRRDGLVGHAVTGADDGGHDAALDDVPLRVDGHEAGERKARDTLIERADIVGKGGGEHGQDAVGEVDARPAREGLVVDGAVPLDIVRDVGDMHAEIKFPVLFADGDRVVDVARVLAVHGDDEFVPKIDASREIVERRALGLPFGGLEHLGRKFLFQAVSADERRFLHEEIAAFSENFHHFARGHSSAETADVGDHFRAVCGTLAAVARDEDVGGELPVIGVKRAARPFAAEGADQFGIAALGDGEYFAFVAEAPALSEDEHAVLVVCAAQRAMGDEQVVERGVVGDKKAEPAFVSRDGAGQSAELRGGAEAAGQVTVDRTLLYERAQQFADGGRGLSLEMQFFGDVLLRQKGEGAVAYLLQ